MLFHIDGRIDLIAAGTHISELVLETPYHLINDIRRNILSQRCLIDFRRLFDRFKIRFFTQPPKTFHSVEYIVCTVESSFIVLKRVVVAWCIGQTDQHRRLFERQFAKVFVKVAVSCRLYPIVVVAIADLVKIALDDLLFGQYMLDLDRKYRFFDLSGKLLFIGEDFVLDQLLGQRTSPLNESACFDVLQYRPQNRIGVDTAVLKELGILHRDKPFDKVAWQLIIACIEAVLFFEDIGKFFSVAVIDHRGDFRLVVDQFVRIQRDLIIRIDKCRNQCHSKDHGSDNGPFDQTEHTNPFLMFIVPS